MTIYSLDFQKCFYIDDIQNTLYANISNVINMKDFWLVQEHDINMIINKRSIVRILNHGYEIFDKNAEAQDCSEDECNAIIKTYFYNKDFDQMLGE